MTGDIRWTTDSHGIYFFGSCGIEKMSGCGPTLVGEGSAEFSITASNNRTTMYRILHSGNWGEVITLSSLGAASSSHTHNYLPLSGGTLTGSVSFSGDTYLNYSPSDWEGGWARNPFRISKGDTSLVLGGFGNTGSQVDYIYLGTDYWTSNNIRVYPSSDPSVGDNTILHAGNYTSYCATAGHTHSYLPLSGGSLSGTVTHTSETGTRYKMERKRADGGGWAYEPIQLIGNSGENFFHLGAYGDNTSLTYAYIGVNDYYQENNLRIYSNAAYWGSYKIYHEGNLPAYPTKASWNYDDRYSLLGHSHDYLPLSGGTITGNVVFSGDNYILWQRNTDSAKISFKNSGDADTDSYMWFQTSDNGDEYFRWSHNSGGDVEWATLKSDGLRIKGNIALHEGNYTSYTVKKDGTGASGTWGISISGSSSSSGNSDTVDGYHASSFMQRFNPRSDLNSIYDLRNSWGGYDKGDYGGAYASEYPTAYGRVLSICDDTKNMAFIMMIDTPTSNACGHIYLRTRGAGDWNTTYSDWKTVAFIDDNVSSASYASNADTVDGYHYNNLPYLPLSGGYMTGGNISWSGDSHGVYFYNGCGIEKWSGYGPSLVAESGTTFEISSRSDRSVRYTILHTGNWSSYISIPSALSNSEIDTIIV